MLKLLKDAVEKQILRTKNSTFRRIHHIRFTRLLRIAILFSDVLGIPFLPGASDLSIFLGLEHVTVGACDKSTIATVGRCYMLQCA